MSYEHTPTDLESGLSRYGGRFKSNDPRSQLTVTLNTDSTTAQNDSAADPQAPPPAYLSASSQKDDNNSETWDPTARTLSTEPMSNLRGGGYSGRNRGRTCGVVTGVLVGTAALAGTVYLIEAHKHGLPPWRHPHPDDDTSSHHHHYASRNCDRSESGAGDSGQGSIEHRD